MANQRVAGAGRRRSKETLPAVAPSRAPEVRPEQPDNLIHERTRLGIVSALAATDKLSFTQLKAVLKTTDGNVSAHARKLEDAGYVTAQKRFEGRVPRTEYALTPAGREALERYIDHMEALLRSVRSH